MKTANHFQTKVQYGLIGTSYPIAALFVAGLLSATSAFPESTVKTGEIVISGTQYQILDKDLLTIKFEKGSAALSDSSLVALSDFAKTTGVEAKVDKYIVASWADQDYPAKGKLSRDQRKLANQRSKNIKKVLEAAGSQKTSTFSMTKQPNWIQRAFSTESAEIKNKGSNSTANERLSKEIGQRLHEKGGPDMAVIVARFKNEVSSG